MPGRIGGIALIVGGGARDLDLPSGADLVLQRHGDEYTLPHRIDHAANMSRVAASGCDRVLAIGSVGGLRRELAPGSFVCPDDFIALDLPMSTALSGLAAHRVPGFDRDWRDRVGAAFGAALEADGGALRDHGVYRQVRGPRLETPAEIRAAARDADVIGMTIASECVAAGEQGIAYAAICVVDNFANGIADHELSLAEVEAGRSANQEALRRALATALPRLA